MKSKSPKRAEPLDVESVNPRYEGLTLGGMARLLTRPRSPAARAAIDRLQGRSVTPENLAKEPPAVKSAL